MKFKVIWFDRKFKFVLEPSQFPAIIERLRATPPALEELIANVPSDTMINKTDEKWSIQENVGHLIAVERLTIGRIDDFLGNKERLRPADITNKLTYDSDYNSRPIDEILSEFRIMRSEAVSKFDALSEEDAELTALHPRLEQPMRLIDHAYFIAEHDAHHLAVIKTLLGS